MNKSKGNSRKFRLLTFIEVDMEELEPGNIVSILPANEHDSTINAHPETLYRVHENSKKMIEKGEERIELEKISLTSRCNDNVRLEWYNYLRLRINEN